MAEQKFVLRRLCGLRRVEEIRRKAAARVSRIGPTFIWDNNNDPPRLEMFTEFC
jgi:hypothetical protein